MTLKIKMPGLLSSLYSLLASSYLICCYFARVYSSNALYYMLLFFGVVFILLCIGNRKIVKFIFGYILFFISVTLLSSVRGFSADNFLISFPSCAFAFFVVTKHINEKYLAYTIYGTALLILYRLLSNPAILLGIEHFCEGSSVNYISAILISEVSIFMCVCSKNQASYSLFPVIIVFIVSALSGSRAGLIFSGILLLYLLVQNLRGSHLSPLSIFAIVISSIILLYFSSFINDIFQISDLIEKFSDEGFSYEENARSEMLQIYLSKINLSTFFWGYDFLGSGIFENHIHPHNSYLIMHRNFGIVAMIICIMILKTLKFLSKHNRVLFITFIVLLLRGFTDYVFFSSYEDYAIYTYLLIPVFGYKRFYENATK